MPSKCLMMEMLRSFITLPGRNSRKELITSTKANQWVGKCYTMLCSSIYGKGSKHQHMTSYDCTVKIFNSTFIQYYNVNIASIHITYVGNTLKYICNIFYILLTYSIDPNLFNIEVCHTLMAMWGGITRGVIADWFKSAACAVWYIVTTTTILDIFTHSNEAVRTMGS